MHTVSEILQKKGPHFNHINETAHVRDAIALMKAENLSYLIVTRDGVYSGIFSESDYTHKVILLDKHSDTTLVKEVMTTDLPIVSCIDKAEYCMNLMNASKTRYLPVFEGLDFKGVITMNDLMRESIEEHKKDLTV